MGQIKFRYLLSLTALAGCLWQGHSSADNFLIIEISESGVSGDDWRKISWFDRAARALRDGQGLTETDDLDSIVSRPKSELVQHLQQSPRFVDATMNFALFFYGRYQGHLRETQVDGSLKYRDHLWEQPLALAVGYAMAKQQPSLPFFNLIPELITKPMRPQSPDTICQPEGCFEAPVALIRMRLFLTMERVIFHFTSSNKSEGCDLLQSLPLLFDSEGMGLTKAGFDPRLEQLVINNWLPPMISPPGHFRPVGQCHQSQSELPELIAFVRSLQQQIDQFFEQTRFQGTHPPVALEDFLALSIDSENLPPLQTALTYRGFWADLKNSSTNRNRKRAAYMLDRFFCDTLEPISVDPGSGSGGGDPHGSDTGCLSCHYKLDPMAGLFRNFGSRGTDYTNAEKLVFDDSLELTHSDIEHYFDGWRNEAGEWQVGYYGAPGRPHSQWHGNSLVDFFEFAKTSADVRSCVVKRMAEFFIGKNLLYDPGWLDEIAQPLQSDGYTPESFRQLTSSLILSDAFAQTNPDPKTCYDLPADASSSQRPPCAVAHILQKNCTSCHNSQFAYKNLNLESWIPMADGKPNFPHAPDGVQLDRNESLRLILDRLTTASTGSKMPMGIEMSSSARADLVGWVTDQIEHRMEKK